MTAKENQSTWLFRGPQVSTCFQVGFPPTVPGSMRTHDQSVKDEHASRDRHKPSETVSVLFYYRTSQPPPRVIPRSGSAAAAYAIGTDRAFTDACTRMIENLRASGTKMTPGRSVNEPDYVEPGFGRVTKSLVSPTECNF